jgi:HPr kinase/phosphorylase
VTGTAGRPDEGTIHATAVAFGGFGILILGPSGSGKSGLALRLMTLGARLVADDRVILDRQGDVVRAVCPPPLAGRIEARGIGILTVGPAGQPPQPAILRLAVDLGPDSDARMPQPRQCDLAGVNLPLIAGRGVPNLAEALALVGRTGTFPLGTGPWQAT